MNLFKKATLALCVLPFTTAAFAKSPAEIKASHNTLIAMAKKGYMTAYDNTANIKATADKGEIYCTTTTFKGDKEDFKLSLAVGGGAPFHFKTIAKADENGSCAGARRLWDYEKAAKLSTKHNQKMIVDAAKKAVNENHTGMYLVKAIENGLKKLWRPETGWKPALQSNKPN